MPWRNEGVMDQRARFVLRVKSGEVSMSGACREFGVTRATGYLWLRRYEEAGSVTGLREKSRRPHVIPRQTEKRVEEAVVRLREKTGWGAKKIGTLLGRQGDRVPVITIHRILVRQNLVNQDGSERQATKRFEKSAPNEMSQMDFKGDYPVKGGRCYPLSFLDDHSRFAIGLWPLTSTNGNGVHESLRENFRDNGVPQAVLLDHGTPWFSGTNGHGLTWVSVWMIKQGIKLIFAGRNHPQTSGKVERFHRTLKERTKHRGLPQTIEEWEDWALEFRREYNEERPHEALGMKTPAEVYTHANLRPYEENPREWHYEGGRVVRLDAQGKVRYRGQAYFVCEALAREWVQIDELDDQLMVTFRQIIIREINLKTGKSTAVLLDRESRSSHSNCPSISQEFAGQET